jgi:hypothetical protein
MTHKKTAKVSDHGGFFATPIAQGATGKAST